MEDALGMLAVTALAAAFVLTPLGIVHGAAAGYSWLYRRGYRAAVLDRRLAWTEPRRCPRHELGVKR